MLARSNFGPITRWYRHEMVCGIIRHRLYVNGRETPYFVDDARKAGRGHYTQGDPVGLFAAGSGNEVRCRDGTCYRVAATLGSFRNVGLAKARAEQKALASP